MSKRILSLCKNRKIVVSCLLLIFSSVRYLLAQNVDAQYPTPAFEYLSIKNGLPENSLTCILQDYLGYLWLGTQNGLVKYDGYSMDIFQTDTSNLNNKRNTIVTIYEDANKVLWIGTWDGLDKFNRANESFKYYRHNPNDKNSLNSSEIHRIYEDRSGRFWVGTRSGLNLFDRDKEKFTRYYFINSDSGLHYKSTPGQNDLPINAIIENPVTGDLLIGTCQDGLWSFNIEKKTVYKYKFASKDNYDKKIGWIQSFYESRDGKIWMASYHSLSSLNPKNRVFKSYIEFPIIREERYPKPIIISAGVIEDQSGVIWFGSTAGTKGVFCYNPESGFLNRYEMYPDLPVNSNYNRICTVYEDHSGIIWAGSWSGGLAKFDKKRHKFNSFNNEPGNSNNISYPFVYSVFPDPKGFIWFGTTNSLDKYEIKTGKLQHYLKNKEFISKNNYKAIIDKSGDIWIAAEKYGLIRFKPENNSYNFYFNNPNQKINLIDKRISNILQDHLGVLWIPTEGFGVYKYDIAENKLTNYKHIPNDPSGLSADDKVHFIFEDSFGTIWIGTNLRGLYRFDRNTEKFTSFGLECILEIFEDKKRNFWIADYMSGLNLFDRKKGKIIANFNQKDGLAYNVITGILEDDHNNLWISTENGLSKFSKKNKTFKNYYVEDGLPDNRFLRNVRCKSTDGRMYFGTEAGIIIFHPDSVRDDTVPPKVVISKISLFNRPNEKLNYKGFISELKEITLPYNQNDLRFDFVGLHYSEPEKNKYKYFLENFDNNWVDAGTQRNATYTNLDPGEYFFRIKAANKDGVWNKIGASISIIITPPWWETWWAYSLYVLAFSGILFLFWNIRLRQIHLKHQADIEHINAKKILEVDNIKSSFFTNISHEFRTPLTLILGPVKQIIDRIKDERTKSELQIVHKNANNLLKLVNQLLDISKLESGNMKLRVSPENIIPLLKAMLQSFCPYAERKRINLKFNSTLDEIIIYIDKEKIEKVITNILSNAFKFTPERGEIEVSINSSFNSLSKSCHSGLDPESQSSYMMKKQILNQVQNDKSVSFGQGKYVEISIRDTGIGISQEELPKIFDRFYQVDGSHTREHEGTGIGLSLTKELIELHKGKIEVESEEGKGTKFIISLPLGKECFKPEEIIEVVTNKEEKSYSVEEPIFIGETSTNIKSIYRISATENPFLLIVEDNYDVRNYIKNNLVKDYMIIEAVDGKDGWCKSIKQIPDLIISDIMMPKMDGFKLCEKLKTDIRTSHIPVILLTAKATSQDKIDGFDKGADEYLMKPFDVAELKSRIKNLLVQRKRMHEHFLKNGLFELEEKKTTPIDQKFLQKAVEIINKNIADSNFNVEKFAESLTVGRSNLNKKFIALIGEPPVEFIKRIRLNKSAELIKKRFGNISEISMEVGFNNPAYFSECFRKQFGVAPSKYLKNI